MCFDVWCPRHAIVIFALACITLVATKTLAAENDTTQESATIEASVQAAQVEYEELLEAATQRRRPPLSPAERSRLAKSARDKRDATLGAILAQQASRELVELEYSECVSLAVACERLDDVERSIDYSHFATERWPDRIDAWRMYTRALINSGKLADAEGILNDKNLSDEVHQSIESLYFSLHAKYKSRGELKMAASSLDHYVRHLCRRIEREPFVAKHLSDGLRRQDELHERLTTDDDLEKLREEYLDLISPPSTELAYASPRDVLGASFVHLAQLEMLQRLDAERAGAKLVEWNQLLIAQLTTFSGDDNIWTHMTMVTRYLLDMNYLISDSATIRETANAARHAVDEAETETKVAQMSARVIIATVDQIESLISSRVQLDDYTGSNMEQLGTPAWVMAEGVEAPKGDSRLVLHVTTARELRRSPLVHSLQQWARSNNLDLAFAVIAQSSPGTTGIDDDSPGKRMPFDRELAAHQRFVDSTDWSHPVAVFPARSDVGELMGLLGAPITLWTNEQGAVEVATVSATPDVVTHLRGHHHRRQ